MYVMIPLNLICFDSKGNVRVVKMTFIGNNASGPFFN